MSDKQIKFLTELRDLLKKYDMSIEAQGCYNEVALAFEPRFSDIEADYVSIIETKWSDINSDDIDRLLKQSK